MTASSSRHLPEKSDGVVLVREFVADDAPALTEIWRDLEIRARSTTS